MSGEILGTIRHWGKVPYHYLIDDMGRIEHTRADNEAVGSTKNTSANLEGLQIALIGNFNNHKPTDAQYMALRKLISSYGLPVKLHRDVSPTACPGKYFKL